jgi:hypothetical protein
VRIPRPNKQQKLECQNPENEMLEREGFEPPTSPE